MVLGGAAQAGSTDARYGQWIAALPFIKSNPITGHGFAMGGFVIQSSIDSYVISLLIETGIPGFIFFSGLLLIPVWYGVRNYLSDTSETGAAAGAVACSFVAFTANRLVLSQKENHMLMFSLLAICRYPELRVCSETSFRAAKPKTSRQARVGWKRFHRGESPRGSGGAPRQSDPGGVDFVFAAHLPAHVHSLALAVWSALRKPVLKPVVDSRRRMISLAQTPANDIAWASVPAVLAGAVWFATGRRVAKTVLFAASASVRRVRSPTITDGPGNGPPVWHIVAERSGGRRGEDGVFQQLVSMIKLEDVDRRRVPFVST